MSRSSLDKAFFFLHHSRLLFFLRLCENHFLFLLGLENSDNGWGGDLSSTSMLNDTALALSALKSVNYSNQATISNAILYLITNQNSDGGWGGVCRGRQQCVYDGDGIAGVR